MKQIKFLKPKELLLICLLAAAALAAMLLLPRTANEDLYAQVSYNNQVVERISLTDDGHYEIAADLPVTLEVRDGQIRFVGSHCPDKLCEGFGWIGEEYEYAICLPAGVAVQIMAEE